MARGKNKKIALSEKDTLNILLKGTSGVLALIGKDGYPYTVTVNYCCSSGKIYFRGANAGQNSDSLKHNAKASFCVINKGKVDKETKSTIFSTALAFGDIKPVTNKNEKQAVIEKLNAKYNIKPKPAAKDEEPKDETADISILVFSIEHLTGQQTNEVISFAPKAAAAPKKPILPKKKKPAKKEAENADEDKVPAEK